MIESKDSLFNNFPSGTKKFISANDVQDIDTLIQKGLEYKANPFKHRSLGAGK